jgi:hypothetical protein
MMEAASTLETSVNLYQTTRRNHPEDGHLHTLAVVRTSNIPYCILFQAKMNGFEENMKSLKQNDLVIQLHARKEVLCLQRDGTHNSQEHQIFQLLQEAA